MFNKISSVYTFVSSGFIYAISLIVNPNSIENQPAVLYIHLHLVPYLYSAG